MAQSKNKSKKRSVRPITTPRVAAKNSFSSAAAKNPVGRNESQHEKSIRSVSWIILGAAVSIFLLGDPKITRVWIEPSTPWWLPKSTLLIGIVSAWTFTRALLVAQLRAMSLGEGFREDKVVDRLLSTAFARTGAASLWATLVGLISQYDQLTANEADVTNALGTYATVGVLIGLLLCVIPSYSSYRSSLRLMREGGGAGRKYRLYAQVVISVLDALILLFPGLDLVGQLIAGTSDALKEVAWCRCLHVRSWDLSA